MVFRHGSQNIHFHRSRRSPFQGGFRWSYPRPEGLGLEFGHLERFSGRGTEGGMSQRGASVGKIEEFVGVTLHFQTQLANNV